MHIRSNDSSRGLEDFLWCGDDLTDEKGSFTGFCQGSRKILTAPWNCPFCAKELVEVDIEHLIIRRCVLPKLHGKYFWTTDERRVTGTRWLSSSYAERVIEDVTKLREEKSRAGTFRLVDPNTPLLERDFDFGSYDTREWRRLYELARSGPTSYSREHGKPWYFNEFNTFLACRTVGCQGLRVLRPGSADHNAYSERERSRYVIDRRWDFLDDPRYTDENQAHYYRTVTMGSDRQLQDPAPPETLEERIEKLQQMPRAYGFKPGLDDVEYFEYLERYREELRIGRTNREARFTRNWKCVDCTTTFELPMDPKLVPEIWWTFDSPSNVKCPKCSRSEATIPVISVSDE